MCGLLPAVGLMGCARVEAGSNNVRSAAGVGIVSSRRQWLVAVHAASVARVMADRRGGRSDPIMDPISHSQECCIPYGRTLLPTAQPAHHSKPPVRQQDGRILSSRSGSERCVQPPPTCTSSYHHVPRGRAPQATTTTDVGEFPPREGGGDAQPNNCEQQCILLPTIALHPTVSPRQRPRLPCLGASMV
jgi:hypothetical protein